MATRGRLAPQLTDRGKCEKITSWANILTNCHMYQPVPAVPNRFVGEEALIEISTAVLRESSRIHLPQDADPLFTHSSPALSISFAPFPLAQVPESKLPPYPSSIFHHPLPYHRHCCQHSHRYRHHQHVRCTVPLSRPPLSSRRHFPLATGFQI